MVNTNRKSKEIKTIYDLAEHTGLATSTISRVLNQRGRINTRTRQRVLSAAREAGFKPRVSARQTVVAVVLDRIRYSTHGGFISSMLTHLINQIAEHDLTVEVFTENSMHGLGNRFIDAIIAMSWDQTTLNHLKRMKDVPIVFVNGHNLPGTSLAASDHYQSGELAGNFFLNHGHTRIAFLAEEHDWGAEQRLHGLTDALQAHGHTLPPASIGFTGHQPIHDVLRKLVAQKPTGLFLAGEDLAMEGAFILTDCLGIKVPDEVSIIGLENTQVSRFTRPPLTTLRQPLQEIAREALRIVLEQRDSKRFVPQKTFLRNTVVERESVR